MNQPLATVCVTFTPLFTQADAASPRVDELLLGATCRLLQTSTNGWAKLGTASGTQGWAAANHLQLDADIARQWAAYGKMAARAPWVDVLAAPQHSAALLVTLPRGGLVHPLDGANEEGWLPVGLPDGQKGWAKQGNLMPEVMGKDAMPQEQLREALAATALSYLSTQYRQGGKTPQGIDAKGLCAMACWLNGCPEWSADSGDSNSWHSIPKEKLAMGDLILFAGHVAMYLGDDQYVHATAQNGSDGVVINSLDESSTFYRADLAGQIAGYRSLFN